ncbi:efflux transporter outer membrane subunit [Novosphingobium sp.]|uniref:efflux transporter outer membrane subunit n=1 Tax=Novosphingobium sp. TaxID=1874826 RepID=UPI0025FD3719|nr:efflux transporter outer membrane subunit [Novosphingobium sp.]
MRIDRLKRLAVAGAVSALAGCTLAPAYHAPETATPPVFKEASATPAGLDVSGWTSAKPRDVDPRGPWWTAFHDPVLDDLEARAEKASPTLAAALARYDASLAATRATRADQLPQAGLSASESYNHLSADRPQSIGSAPQYNDVRIGGGLSYELDLWGRIRSRVASARAEAQASQADLGSAHLSLQTAVADAYARLRGLDAEAALLHQTVEAYAKAYDLTRKRHDGGIASGVDVNRAQTVLGNARAQISAVAQTRAATEHELAALTGELASAFAVPPRVEPLSIPLIGSGVPSAVLERRPDVAAAERRIAAANARIGVARAAFFPTITLGASGGFETTGAALIAAPSAFWAFGPALAALTVFDGGRRAAQVRISRDEYDQLAATYRDTVLTAFRQAEDAIAAQRLLATQAADQQSAADAAARTSSLAYIRYRDGASNYLEVVTAQTDALTAERALIQVQTRRVQAAVALVKALGGGVV